MRAAGGLILMYCVTADDSVFAFGNTNVRVMFEPISQRLLTRDIRLHRIRLARRDYFMKNFPDRIAICVCCWTNLHIIDSGRAKQRERRASARRAMVLQQTVQDFGSHVELRQSISLAEPLLPRRHRAR